MSRKTVELTVELTEVATRNAGGKPASAMVRCCLGLQSAAFTRTLQDAPRVGDMVRVTYEWGEDE